MSLIRGADSKPELILRRLVHRLGFRFRLHVRRLPGCPDLVFSSRKKVIFMHGCFWHRHGIRCPLTRWPKSRLDFWREKLDDNRRRDLKIRRKLRGLGWKSLVVWECELCRDSSKLERKLQAFLER